MIGVFALTAVETLCIAGSLAGWLGRSLWRHGLRVSVLAFGLGLGAFASPVTYDITFLGALSPPSGSFTYDDTAPLSSRFSNFTVSDAGISFNLTSAANTGEIFIGSDCGTTPSSQSVFMILSGQSVCVHTSTSAWGRNTADSLFYFIQQEPGVLSYAAITASGSSRYPFTAANETGAFTIAPVAPSSAPEPGSLVLGMTGITFIFCSRLRHRRARRQEDSGRHPLRQLEESYVRNR